jgi:hypothetical protein
MKIVLSFIASFLLSSSTIPAEKFRYRSSGKGGYAYAWGDQCGSWPFGSYMDVYASESTAKDKSNGKPGITVFPSMWAYFSLWTDCTDKSATLVELDWENYYTDTPATTVSFPGNKLASGFASTTIPAIKVSCELITESDPEWGEWYYYDCDYGNIMERLSIEVSVTWTGTGNPYQDRSTGTYRYPSGFYRYSYKGNSRDATMSISLKQDGVAQTTGFGELYGALSKSTDTSMSIYKF